MTESNNKRCTFHVTPCSGVLKPSPCSLKSGVCVAHLEDHHFTETPIMCKWCGSSDIIKHGIKDGVQEYLCLKCKREFNRLDAPYGMRSTVEQIGASLGMYFNGESLSDIARRLNETYHNPVERSTIYRWLLKFTKEAVDLFEPIHPKVGDVWIADETVIKFSDVNHWVFDIIDRDTRYLLASYMSQNRGTQQAKILMELAAKRAGKAPGKILTDSLRAYLDGIVGSDVNNGHQTFHAASSPA